MSLDLGTGDGRLPYVLARHDPERLFLGLDANAAGLRELSGRAERARIANVLYVRAGVEELPVELTAIADRVTVVLPWGSLLAGVVLPSVATLARIRAVCQPGARLTIVLSVGERDAAETRRLRLPRLDGAQRESELAAGYAAGGFAVVDLRTAGLEELERWPSTWAQRLAHGQPRPVLRIETRAADHAITDARVGRAIATEARGKER